MWSHEYYHANRTPPGFPRARTLPGATLWSDLEIWHDEISRSSRSGEVIIPSKMMMDRSPTLLCSQGVKDMHINSEYDKIRELIQKIRKDVEGVNKLIRDGGVNAFRVIQPKEEDEQQPKQRFYVAYDATASVWVYPLPKKTKRKLTQSATGETITRYTSVFQLGKYSSATDVAGTVDFTFEHTVSGDINCLLAAKIVEVMQSTFKEDINTDIILQFIVDQLIVYEADDLDWSGKIEKLGGNSCVATYAAMTAVQVLCCILYWAFKKYSIKLRIFNWCRESSLSISKCYLDNTDMVQVKRDITNRTNIKIPEAPGLTPVLFEPLIPFAAACHYVTIFFANSFNFFSGCGFALKIEIDKSKSGINESKPEISELKPEISEPKPETSESKSEINGSVSEISESKSEINGSESEITESEPEINRSEPEISGSKSEITESKLKIDESIPEKGFFYAFDCKRFANNRQKACEISEFANQEISQGSPKEVLKRYYETHAWNKNPLRFTTQVENTPVAITLNALNCSRDRYFPIINFGYKYQ